MVFVIPFPKSYSKATRDKLRRTPHQLKPDTDNLMKAVKDALCVSDEHIWFETGVKIWGDSGKVLIRNISSPMASWWIREQNFKKALA